MCVILRMFDGIIENKVFWVVFLKNTFLLRKVCFCGLWEGWCDFMKSGVFGVVLRIFTKSGEMAVFDRFL